MRMLRTRRLKKARAAIGALMAHHDDVEKRLSNINDRVLGCISLSPPLIHGAGPNKYTTIERSESDRSYRSPCEFRPVCL